MTIYATCSICGKTTEYKLSAKEKRTLLRYEIEGRSMGFLQDLFPDVPPWIRSGAIDQFAGGFCICPDCM